MICWCSHNYLLCPHIRTICHSPQLCVTFHNMLLLGGEWSLVTCPTSKLDVCLFLAFHDCLLSVFTTAFYLGCHLLAMPWLIQLVTSPSLQSSRFDPVSFCVGTVLKKWHWNRFFSKHLSFPLSVPFHQCLVHFIHPPPTLYILVNDSIIK